MKTMVALAGVLSAVVAIGPASGAAGPQQGVQSNADFASSYAALGVTNASVTSQQRSCYRPEVAYFDALPADQAIPAAAGRRARTRRRARTSARTRRRTQPARRIR